MRQKPELDDGLDDTGVRELIKIISTLEGYVLSSRSNSSPPSDEFLTQLDEVLREFHQQNYHASGDYDLSSALRRLDVGLRRARGEGAM